MARSVAKASAPVAAVQAVMPAPVAIGAPSAEARAAGHAMGADLAGLLEQLKLQLVKSRQLLSTIIWLSPPDDDRLRSLRSLMKRLCLFMGEVDMFAP